MWVTGGNYTVGGVICILGECVHACVCACVCLLSKCVTGVRWNAGKINMSLEIKCHWEGSSIRSGWKALIIFDDQLLSCESTCPEPTGGRIHLEDRGNVQKPIFQDFHFLLLSICQEVKKRVDKQKQKTLPQEGNGMSLFVGFAVFLQGAQSRVS